MIMESVAKFDVLPLVEPPTSDSYSLEKLPNDSDLYRQITVDFHGTGMVIQSIDAVKNHNNWKKYHAKKKLTDTRRPQDPDFKLNETYLYHGTSADKSILCEEGFDVNLASDGCFGRGLYFSDNPQKCFKYARNGIIILARVILGTAKEYEKGKKDSMLVREPEKPINCKGWRKYDSVKGCPRNFTEYVIYRNDAALIEYIIEFKKDDSDSATMKEYCVQPKISEEPAEPNVDVGTKSDREDSDSSDSEDSFDDAKEEYSTTTTDDNDEEEEEEGNKNPGTTVADDDEECQKDPGIVCKSESDSDKEENLESRLNQLSTSVIPYFEIKEGELTLDEKKTEYKRITLEENDDEVDTMMKKTSEDLERAVYLFYAYKQVKEEKAKREAGEFVEDEPIQDDGSPIFPPMEPTYESQLWNDLSETDKKTKTDKAIEDFLTFTALEEIHRHIAVNYVTNAKYNLDTAVLNYYKCWL